MRTAIILGALMIAGAIDRITEIVASEAVEYSDRTSTFFAIVICAMIIMDIVDFFTKEK